MLPQLLCAALALAAPAGEPRDIPTVGMPMEIYPRKIAMLGDVVIVKITAINRGKKAAPLPMEYDRKLGQAQLQIRESWNPYRYFWEASGGPLMPGRGPLVPLPPGEKRVVFFDMIELPPIRDIRHEFWTDLAEEEWDGAEIVVHLGGVFRTHDSIEEIRPRPKKEVEAIVKTYAQEIPQGFNDWGKLSPSTLGLGSFPTHMATPEKMAALESKLSAGTLRDMLRATRLLQIVVANKAHPRGAAQRRAAAKELLALLDASAELERQWLAYAIFYHLYYRSIYIELDEIEWGFLETVAEDVPDFLWTRSDGNGATYGERWSTLKRKRETPTVK